MNAPVAGPFTMGRVQWAGGTRMSESAGTLATVMATAFAQLTRSVQLCMCYRVRVLALLNYIFDHN